MENERYRLSVSGGKCFDMNLAITKKQARLSPFVPCILGFMVLLFLRDYIGTSIPNILFLVTWAR